MSKLLEKLKPLDPGQIRDPKARLEWFVRQVKPGKPPRNWSFEGREYLQQIIQDAHANLVIEKSAQSGISTVGIGESLLIASAGYHCGWFLPTDQEVADFVDDPLNPMIDANDDLVKLVVSKGIETDKKLKRKGGGRADNTWVMHFGQGALRFRGIQKATKVKRIALDCAYIDEADEVAHVTDPDLNDMSLIDLIPDRLLASELKWQREYSQPGIPGLGVDVSFQDSDQTYWTAWCRKPGCKAPIILEESFPHCLMGTIGNGGAKRHVVGAEISEALALPQCDEWYLCCPHCHSRLKLPREGGSWHWVSKHPGRDVRGYHVSQLYGPQLTAREIARKWHEAQRSSSKTMAFFISILGIAHAGDRRPVTRDQVAHHSKPLQLARDDRGPLFGGIDQGNRLHITIFEMDKSSGELDLVFAEETGDWKRAALVMQYCDAFVCDGGPNWSDAKRLCAQLKKGVFVYSWNKQRHGFNPKEDVEAVEFVDGGQRHQVRGVKLNRDEVYQDYCDDVRFQRVRYPAPKHPVTEQLLKHVEKMVKDKEGTHFVRGVENHYSVAGALARMAAFYGNALRLTAGGALKNFKAQDAIIRSGLHQVTHL